MGVFLNYAINGIAYGLILFLIATGMTLTMGLLRVVNMSHGAIFMVSGYFGTFVYHLLGKTATGLSDTLSWLISLVAAGALAGLLGFGIEFGFLRPLYASPMSQVLLTIGLINIITNASLWIFGGSAIATPVPAFLTDNGIRFGGIRIPYLKFFIILVGLIIALLLWLMQDKTNIGAKVRAGMDNGIIAGTMGVDKKKIFAFVFILGSAIAGLSAIIGGSVITIDQNTGWNVLLNSIIVVVIGGSGSIPGAFISGIILGLVNTTGVWLTTSGIFKDIPAFKDVNFASFLSYVVLIIVLVIRPQGIMGRKIDIDKASDDYSSTKGIERPLFTRSMLGDSITVGTKSRLAAYKSAPYLFFLILAIVLPFISSPPTQNILSEILIYALFAASLDIVMGYTGNRSFGHAAYFGMGAYIVVLFNRHLGLSSFWVLLIITIVVCAILAAVIGYFTLKLTGTNFLLVTMAFGQLLSVMASQFKELTGGTDGEMLINKPNLGFTSETTAKWNEWWSQSFTFFGKELGLNFKLYMMILIFVIVCYIIMHTFMKSSFGSSLQGIKGNEGRMRALGFNTWRFRYTAVIIAGIFAGIAGLLYAYRFKTVTPRVFAIERSAMPMLMIIIGGGTTLWGPMIGAAIIVLVQNYAGILFPDRWQMLLGLIYVVCVMFLKSGFAPMLQKLWNWIGYKLFKKDFIEEPKISIKKEANI
ncbi:MAG: ABC transporter permease [Lachnospiraceae bacterium]